MDDHNPHLKAAFIETVENQLENNDPPEARETLARLMNQGISEDDAKVYIAQAISIEVFDLLQNQGEFSNERYVKNLKRLPSEPKQ
ncbi:hypothetical protein HZ994_09430 [Akkermansiaceae bacterium]|nr:hypothetical protein HZ994_09430 [Akkermansiaceae bacterium]